MRANSSECNTGKMARTIIVWLAHKCIMVTLELTVVLRRSPSRAWMSRPADQDLSPKQIDSRTYAGSSPSKAKDPSSSLVAGCWHISSNTTTLISLRRIAVATSTIMSLLTSAQNKQSTLNTIRRSTLI